MFTLCCVACVSRAAGRCTAPEGTEEYTRVQEAAKAYILNLFKSKYTETEKKVRGWGVDARV